MKSIGAGLAVLAGFSNKWAGVIAGAVLSVSGAIAGVVNEVKCVKDAADNAYKN